MSGHGGVRDLLTPSANAIAAWNLVPSEARV